LRDLLRGRVTAVQLMFSKCRSICPIEAVTLARVQDALGHKFADNIRLLSLSIDPETDTPAVLKAWVGRVRAAQGGTAGAPGGGEEWVVGGDVKRRGGPFVRD